MNTYLFTLRKNVSSITEDLASLSCGLLCAIVGRVIFHFIDDATG
jgi:hypothetical protein